jgi:hypothetical protein
MEIDRRSMHDIPKGGSGGGGGPLDGINLWEAGKALDEGRVKDAISGLLAMARARIAPQTIQAGGKNDLGVDEIVWKVVWKARTVDCPESDEKKNPWGWEPEDHAMYVRHMREMTGEWEALSAGLALRRVRERYLSAYGREFVRLQGGDKKTSGAGWYFKKNKLQGQNLWKDAGLLSAGRVTVVHAILQYVCKVRDEQFQMREKAIGEALRRETNGFPDEETVKAAVRDLAVPRVMKAFDDEVAVSLGLLQKSMLKAIRRAEEEAG